MKAYRDELVAIQNRLARRQPFAFARFGDGKLRIPSGQRNRYPEFRYDPADPADAFFRERLFDALRDRRRTPISTWARRWTRSCSVRAGVHGAICEGKNGSSMKCASGRRGQRR
jgi:hypothetical protein